VKSDEVQPVSTVQKKFIIDKIMEKLKVRNRIVYKVLWDDGDITEEPRTKLLSDVPFLVKEFEDNLKLSNKGLNYVVKIENRFKEKNKIYFDVVWSDDTKTKIARIELNKIANRLMAEYEHKLKLAK
jgi:hypothetical protein